MMDTQSGGAVAWTMIAIIVAVIAAVWKWVG